MADTTDAQSKTVYLLLLANDEYYVGATADLDQRIDQHRSGEGAEWTEDRSVVDARVIVEQTPDWKRIEKEVTLRLMATHGWERVRGGPWSSVELDGPPNALLDK